MYKSNIKPETILSDLIIQNPALLLMMEHFGLNYVVHNDTIKQICETNKLSENIFISIVRLYYKDYKLEKSKHIVNEIRTLLLFLKNSHQYFKNEKYPEIQKLIELIQTKNKTTEIKLVEKFFDEYFYEVVKHLDYEEKTVFPYINNLLENKNPNKKFTINTYSKKHTDIEYKITELKNLLLKHIELKEDMVLRRKLLLSLYELEEELNIHTIIEDNILIPLINKLEQG